MSNKKRNTPTIGKSDIGMNRRTCSVPGGLGCLLLAGMATCFAGEKQIVSLRDLHDTQVKSAGFRIEQEAILHIKAVGAAGENKWFSRGGDRAVEMNAYPWIIDAGSRNVVWEMTVENSSKWKDERTFDGTITLPSGYYEVYIAAATFSFSSTFTHISITVDHRKSPLFGKVRAEKNNFFTWLFSWWSDDIQKTWDKRSPLWGVDLYVDESVGTSSFNPPKPRDNVVLRATGLGENEVVRKSFALGDTATLSIYALGEGDRENQLADYGWIINNADRKRVWEMQMRNCTYAGGADKNIRYVNSITLPRGEYTLYYVTDGSHSSVCWNANPPYDPLNWGITVAIDGEKERKSFRTIPEEEDRNVIVSLVHPKNSDYLSAGFTLKKEARLRVYAIGERDNSRRSMADYGTILDAKKRERVWTMDVDRTSHAGGASKNQYIDEIITLPPGTYIVTYTTDDSHTYDDWNSDPPYDKEHYGITVMGVGEKWDPSIVGKYVEERDRNIIAQIIRPGNDADISKPFTLNKTTRVRIYAIGEGMGREMDDYGWIEDGRTGTVVWQMTYRMTFHAGGDRKNRMVNTTIILDRGSYRLRFKSDDSHSFGDWNADPPDDQQYWGITLYRDERPSPPGLPAAPVPPNIPEPPEDPGD
jgi:hypothetical protein